VYRDGKKEEVRIFEVLTKKVILKEDTKIFQVIKTNHKKIIDIFCYDLKP